jgi:NAD(P)-dependent dehydrogenase (short-subunit alcohol dehydrogenase family)
VRGFVAVGAETIGLDIRPGDGIVICDVCDEGSVETTFGTIAAVRPITSVVHAAGTGSVGAVRQLSLSEWRRSVDVNLTGSLLVLRAAARRLGPGSSITLIASVGGLRGEALTAAYSASKFGVLGLMQAAAKELAPDRIRVNAICPGADDTPLGEAFLRQRADVTGSTIDELRTEQAARVPIGAVARTAQIADMCLFLASEIASHVAGA